MIAGNTVGARCIVPYEGFSANPQPAYYLAVA